MAVDAMMDYPDQGEPMDVTDHPDHNLPHQQFPHTPAGTQMAGDVVPMRDIKDPVNMVARINQFQNRIRSPSKSDDNTNVAKIK